MPEQLVWPAGQAQTPPAPQTPLTGDVHAPDVRGPAEQAVLDPEQTTVPDCAHPPVPADVHAAPVARHVPPQLV